ncbi:MAG: biotin carboxylase N-terminal domain-containing protein [Chloroflexota bacterium]
MIESVLIANRGEIAVRIIRTCRRMGIRSVAIYSDADARSMHVGDADQAFPIGRAPADDSYLNQARILEVARTANAAAIHPGYGFLAESADFAQACLDAGLVWVGPPPGAMRALGDKARAKAVAEQYGVPLLPGYHGEDQSLATLQHHADRIGYPVMVKASAGGGGRGMRVVHARDVFADALEAARREALANFGDERVLLERYVRRPRHVEVQIMGDQHGRLIHLGERECSVQRRHQKLIEETPSPGVDGMSRRAITEAALRLARGVGYANAGTVEFLLDEQGQLAFLEVNARLQVEHPVTEAVTGLDLVELQLRVAAGEPLPLAQEDVRFVGHAIEARVIAEDPLAGFVPSIGTLTQFGCPGWVRVDTWVQAGTAVSPYYDSLLAKVIAHGQSRAEAAGRLADALAQMRVEGVQHNLDLLLAVIQHPVFRDGQAHTSFLDEHRLVDDLAEVPPQALAAASGLDLLIRGRDANPWRAHTGWRLGRVDQPASWSRAGRAHSARVSAELGGEGVHVNTGGEQLLVRLVGAQRPTAGDRGDRRARLNVEGHALTVVDFDSQWRVVEWRDRSFRLQRTPPLNVDEAAGGPNVSGGPGRLTAPMPGRVVRIAVRTGQRVAQNQPLVVLEAMKMEHVVEAPYAGLVAELCVNTGDQVVSGAQLLMLGSVDTDPEGELPRAAQ